MFPSFLIRPLLRIGRLVRHGKLLMTHGTEFELHCDDSREEVLASRTDSGSA